MAVRDVEKVGDELRKRVKGLLGEIGWTQNLVLAVLARVEDVVQTEISKVGPHGGGLYSIDTQSTQEERESAIEVE